MTRIRIFTGKGGVGKTSVAAACAWGSASRGSRTLVVSTDAAHSIGDVLDRRIGPDIVHVVENLDESSSMPIASWKPSTATWCAALRR